VTQPLDRLLERAPSFDRFGKLCAIELFEHIGDPRAAAVLGGTGTGRAPDRRGR
jgi:hypothetical protein